MKLMTYILLGTTGMYCELNGVSGIQEITFIEDI